MPVTTQTVPCACCEDPGLGCDCAACPGGLLGDQRANGCPLQLKICQSGCFCVPSILTLRNYGGSVWQVTHFCTYRVQGPGQFLDVQVPIQFSLWCMPDNRIRLMITASDPFSFGNYYQAIAYATPGENGNTCDPVCLNFEDFEVEVFGNPFALGQLCTKWFTEPGTESGYVSDWIIKVGATCRCCDSYCKDLCVDGDMCLSVTNGWMRNCVNGPAVNLSLAQTGWWFVCSGTAAPECDGDPPCFGSGVLFSLGCDQRTLNIDRWFWFCNSPSYCGSGYADGVQNQHGVLEYDENNKLTKITFGPGGWKGFWGAYCGYLETASCHCSGTWDSGGGIILPACVTGIWTQDMVVEIVVDDPCPDQPGPTDATNPTDLTSFTDVTDTTEDDTEYWCVRGPGGKTGCYQGPGDGEPPELPAGFTILGGPFSTITDCRDSGCRPFFWWCCGDRLGEKSCTPGFPDGSEPICPEGQILSGPHTLSECQALCVSVGPTELEDCDEFETAPLYGYPVSGEAEFRKICKELSVDFSSGLTWQTITWVPGTDSTIWESEEFEVTSPYTAKAIWNSAGGGAIEIYSGEQLFESYPLIPADPTSLTPILDVEMEVGQGMIGEAGEMDYLIGTTFRVRGPTDCSSQNVAVFGCPAASYDVCDPIPVTMPAGLGTHMALWNTGSIWVTEEFAVDPPYTARVQYMPADGVAIVEIWDGVGMVEAYPSNAATPSSCDPITASMTLQAGFMGGAPAMDYLIGQDVGTVAEIQ